jgi:hypothetical protein
MTRWEYRVESIAIGSGGIAVWGKFLQGLGKRGWELVNDHVFEHTDADGTTLAVYGTFKRPAKA